VVSLSNHERNQLVQSFLNYQRQEYLIAYRYLPERMDEPLQILLIDFYKIGTHENFYAELKKYLASE
jgi:hypothetical protein